MEQVLFTLVARFEDLALELTDAISRRAASRTDGGEGLATITRLDEMPDPVCSILIRFQHQLKEIRAALSIAAEMSQED
jgi:hypothetical protein